MEEKQPMKVPVKWLAMLVLVALVVIVLFQNAYETPIRLFFWTFHASLVVLVLLIFAVGFLMGYLSRAMRSRRSD